MIKIKSYFYKTHKLNRLKYDEIYNYALQVNDYRNTISNYIYEDIKLLRELRFNKISKVDLINKYKLKYNIASTTKQQQIKVIYTKYKNYLNKLFNNLKFNNSNDNSKLYSHMLRYYYNIEQYTDLLNSKTTKFYKLLLNTFNKLNTNKFTDFILQSQYQLIIDNINLINFNTLTYRDINVPKYYSNMIELSNNIVLTNAVINLNIPKLNSYILPVRYNKRYHGSINYKHNLNTKTKQKQYTIEIGFDELKHEVKIILVNDKSELKPLDFYVDDKDIIGIDVNVRDNLFTTSDNNIIDFDRKLVSKIANDKIKLNKIKSEKEKLNLSKKYSNKKYSNRMLKMQESINKRVKYHQDYMCSKLLKQYKNKHLVLENLKRDLKKSYIEANNFNINYNDLFTLLKLYSIKDTIIRLAPKYGIEISLVNPDYTSQMCSKCYTIDKRNRNKDKFICKNCGYETNADYNASVNIKERVTENVFQKALSINNGVNTYLPKYDKRYKFKLELNLILNQSIV